MPALLQGRSLFPDGFDHEFVVAVVAALIDQEPTALSRVVNRIYRDIRLEYVVTRSDIRAVIDWLAQEMGVMFSPGGLKETEASWVRTLRPLLVEMRRAMLHELLFTEAESG